MIKKKCVLIILDGWGVGEKLYTNAVYAANMPYLEKIKNNYFFLELKCSGLTVGLPSGVMGNSEVGHLSIGSGRIVAQDLLKINKSIVNKCFYKILKLDRFFDKKINYMFPIHLIGLLSDAGVHSQINHLYALIDFAKIKKIKELFIHVILDGRDSYIRKGLKYVKKLQLYIEQLNSGNIITICGRYYFMDRDKRWNRIEKAYNLCTRAVGKIEKNPIKAIKNAYLRGESDEFVKPIFLFFNSKKILKGLVKNKSSLLFFNYRADRAREVCLAFTDLNFKYFKREVFPELLVCHSMTQYDKSFIFESIFEKSSILGILGELVSESNRNQLRIAETEKYAHVTYFFNGGEEIPFLNENRCLIPSFREIKTYDDKPEMSAFLLIEEIFRQIRFDKYDFIVVNFANMDMVGHTGKLSSAIKSCEIVDFCIKKLVNYLLGFNITILITSDHGNSEKIMDSKGHKFTSHTKNKVPFILISNEFYGKKIDKSSLKDIASTILILMKIRKSVFMSGLSLLA